MFVSYSHDSDTYRDKVLALAQRLRKDGLDVHLDRFEKGAPAKGWHRWMLDWLDAAQFVPVLCTEASCPSLPRHERTGSGKGVTFEGLLITSEIYGAYCEKLKFIPAPLRRATNALSWSRCGSGTVIC